MLVVDSGNVIHSGVANSQAYCCGKEYGTMIRGVPYLFHKIANYAVKSKFLVVAFDPEPTGKYVPRNPKRCWKPQVIWELRVLKRLLAMVKAPTLELAGFSADSLIYSVIEDNRHLYEDHFILSVDQDLACNIRPHCGRFSTSMIGFNSMGYDYDVENFEALLGVPFNFININKMLLGCSSDSIASFVKGREIWNEFLLYLSDAADMGSLGEFTTASDFHKVYDPFEFNSKEVFFDWLTKESSYAHHEKELRARAKEIFPKYTTTCVHNTTDWELWNSIARFLFSWDYNVFRMAPERPLTEAEKEQVLDIVDNTPIVEATVFTPSSEINDAEVVSDLSDLKILEGDLN